MSCLILIPSGLYLLPHTSEFQQGERSHRRVEPSRYLSVFANARCRRTSEDGQSRESETQPQTFQSAWLGRL